MENGIFGIGLGELVAILLLAGLVMGPQRIREVARWFGRISVQFRSISRAFMAQLDSELDAAEKGELKAAVQDIQALQREVTELRRELRNAPQVFGQTTKQLRDEAAAALTGTTIATVQDGAAPDDVAADDAPVEENRIAPPRSPLPKPLDVPDDPD